MGGNSAWKKRVASGGLAKGSGGASLRHHPHLGRRGKDLALNRKGNLGGHGNPKRKRTARKSTALDRSLHATLYRTLTRIRGARSLLCIASVLFVFLLPVMSTRYFLRLAVERKLQPT
jgi:hypothetical protein